MSCAVVAPDTKANINMGKTVVDLVHSIPDQWHGRTLYTSREGRMTYGETRGSMLRVARWLAEQHAVRAGQRIAVCLPTGLAAVQLVLGILAAGAAYLPLQFNGPPERLASTLNNAEPHLLITTRAIERRLKQAAAFRFPCPVVTIETGPNEFLDFLAGVSPLAKPVPVDPGSLAAIFFTSGSTGEPKGVMMSYATMTTNFADFTGIASLNENDRIIMLAPLHYVSSIGLFYPLLTGCRSFIASEEEALFPEVVAGILETEKITVWEGAVTRLRHVIESGRLETRNLEAMRHIEFFGEPMPIHSLRAGLEFFPNARFRNGYGTSEAFWLTGFDVPRDVPPPLEGLPIGRSHPLYEVSLCDEDGTPVASGEVGEICAVGPVASIGYWKQPDQTLAARLNGIPNSHRTGDLARLGDDGNYHFVGRRDHRVKIRGHRFELGEIEAVLKAHRSVRDAAAFLIGGEVKACVLAAGYQGLAGELAAVCASRLPVFARPSQMKIMASFPQLPSGKLDRMELKNCWA